MSFLRNSQGLSFAEEKRRVKSDVVIFFSVFSLVKKSGAFSRAVLEVLCACVAVPVSTRTRPEQIHSAWGEGVMVGAHFHMKRLHLFLLSTEIIHASV